MSVSAPIPKPMAVQPVSGIDVSAHSSTSPRGASRRPGIISELQRRGRAGPASQGQRSRESLRDGLELADPAVSPTALEHAAGGTATPNAERRPPDPWASRPREEKAGADAARQLVTATAVAAAVSAAVPAAIPALILPARVAAPASAASPAATTAIAATAVTPARTPILVVPTAALAPAAALAPIAPRVAPA